ncbi:MAG: hypothetical protein KDC04_00585 [Saprospiraceae bacterium]|nr:hypothetical protein [Saprospiraceae bacterium]MCB9310840.1 hypothetical protein [Lewinellaceae bacterium]
MRRLFSIFVFIELALSLILLLKSEFLIGEHPNPVEFIVSKLYGSLDLIVAIMGYLIFKHWKFESLFRKLFLAYTTSHILRAMVFWSGLAASVASFQYLFYFHLGCAAVLLVAYLSDKTPWDDQRQSAS